MDTKHGDRHIGTHSDSDILREIQRRNKSQLISMHGKEGLYTGQVT